MSVPVRRATTPMASTSFALMVPPRVSEYCITPDSAASAERLQLSRERRSTHVRWTSFISSAPLGGCSGLLDGQSLTRDRGVDDDLTLGVLPELQCSIV